MAFDPGDYSISDYAKKYKKEHPIYAPQGSVTQRTFGKPLTPDEPFFTEAEVLAMDTWEENVHVAGTTKEDLAAMPVWKREIVEGGVSGITYKKAPYLVPDTALRIDPVGVAKVSRIPIKAKDRTTGKTKLYYGLDPRGGGMKGTEVDLVSEGLAGEKVFPGAVKIPKINMPKLPSFKFPDFGISALTKGGIALVVLFIAGIVLLLAIGYSGMGESAGRVGEKEYKRKRK